ncbi:TonB-dependent siderophore receptor (plasmid) [Diaphorobacter sp. HDW4B]|uniref:TonB-dependent siderophore receptor n=1 Tax=Diaphorobacter sp. HDW4B TaxID=2714925 RepID=UPI0014087AE0|nr:TonB-dependent siderophore receptor [Diaphorobacter sp. HDW4B]QIL73761.1 TonB-dependent siderophore receptor [Diaphorobacter sp. HDW4B]
MLVMVGATGHVLAQTDPVAPTPVSINAQPLGQALNELARQTHLQLLFPPELVAGRVAPAVSGALTPRQAVERLLAGSGLMAVQEGKALVVKAAPQRGGDSSLPPVTVVAHAMQESAFGPVHGFVAKRSATATKTDTPLSETPQSVTVVPREQMVAQAADSLDQALEYSAGIMSLAGGTMRNIGTGFTVRGFNVTGAGPLYLNGSKFPINSFSGAIEPYHYERIEVLKGPASILYGQAAPGGIFNLVSKRPTAEPLREVEVQLGSWGRKQVAADLSDSLTEDGRVRYRVTALARDADTMLDHTRNDRISVAAALDWQLTDATQLTLLANASNTKGHYDVGKPLEGSLLPNPGGRIARTRFLGEPEFDHFNVKGASLGYQLEHRFNDDWRFKQNTLVYDHEADSAYAGLYANVNPGTPTRATRYGLTRLDHDRGLVIDNQLIGKLQHGRFEHTVLFGLDWVKARFSRNQGFGPLASIDMYNPVYGAQPVFGTPVFSKDAARQTGFYVQDQIKFDKRWIALVGGRYDSARADLISDGEVEKAHAFTPRVGLMYLFDNGISPYYSYSRSFQPSSGRGFSGTAFKPTTGKQHEMGVKYEPKGVDASITVAAYEITQRNVLTADPDHTGFLMQTGEVKSRGLEIEGRASLNRQWDMVAALSSTLSRVTQSNNGNVGTVPVSIPRSMASLWTDYRVAAVPGLSVGAGVRHVGWQEVNRMRMPAYTLFDAAIRYQLDKWQLALNVKNLADKNYVSSCTGVCQFGDERNFTLTARVNW